MNHHDATTNCGPNLGSLQYLSRLSCHVHGWVENDITNGLASLLYKLLQSCISRLINHVDAQVSEVLRLRR